MEQITYLAGIVGYRGGEYPYITCEPQDDTWLTVQLQNTYGMMFISLEADSTEINGVLQETQQQMIDTFNNG
jgi:hypothetical protein